MEHIRINFIYLAAGYAKRFGDNKLLVDFHGKPLFMHGLKMAEKLKKELYREEIEVKILAVTANEKVENYCRTHDILYVQNCGPENDGIASSIRKAIQFLKQDEDDTDVGKGNIYDMFLQADQPYMSSDILQLFIKAFLAQSKPIGAMEFAQSLHSPNIFAVRYRTDLEQLQGDTGGKRVINHNLDQVFCYPVTQGRYFIDIDTMEDYKNENV